MVKTGRTDRWRAILFTVFAVAFVISFISHYVEARGSMALSESEILECRTPFCHIVIPMTIIPLALTRPHFPRTRRVDGTCHMSYGRGSLPSAGICMGAVWVVVDVFAYMNSRSKSIGSVALPSFPAVPPHSARCCHPHTAMALPLQGRYRIRTGHVIDETCADDHIPDAFRGSCRNTAPSGKEADPVRAFLPFWGLSILHEQDKPL